MPLTNLPTNRRSNPSSLGQVLVGSCCRRAARTLIAGVCLLVTPIGCRVSGTSFRMDSDNPTPSLGIQLAPKPKAKDERSRTSAAEPPPPPRSEAVQLTADHEPQPPAKSSSWSDWFSGLKRPKRIPLPLSPSAAEDDGQLPTTAAASDDEAF